MATQQSVQSLLLSFLHTDLTMCPVLVGIPGSVTGMVPFRIFSAEPVSRLRETEPGSTYNVVNVRKLRVPEADRMLG